MDSDFILTEKKKNFKGKTISLEGRVTFLKNTYSAVLAAVPQDQTADPNSGTAEVLSRLQP